MRYLYVSFFIVFLLSCKSKKETVSSINKDEVVNQACPDKGVCKLEVLTSKSLEIKKDNFGKLYPEIVEGKQIVLKFEYQKEKSNTYEDGSYKEEIFIELNPNELDIETTSLKDKKLFFARWCYCKGQTGYYKIDKGHLSVKQIDAEYYKIELDFNIEELPQVIEKLNRTFNLQ